jgi:hypothetical protein
LLRELLRKFGLDRSFTIHDREDSADLLNLIRHDLDLSKNEKRFPTKGHVPCHLFARGECGNPLGDVLRSVFPWCATWEAQLRRLFSAYVEAKQRQHVLDYDDLLLYWAQMMAEPASPATWRSASITFWWTNIRTPTGYRPRSCWASSPAAAALTSWATMRNPSTRSARRPCATFSTFPASSVRAPRSSRSIATTARPSPSSPPPMR